MSYGNGDVPVVWVSYREPNIASGFGGEYHDQGLLRLVMDRVAWRPAGAFEFRHVHGFEDLLDHDEGAVIVLPAQHHAAPEEVARLNADLARLSWVVLILAGDECSLFPWRELDHPNMALWVMTPRPALHRDCEAFFFGEGYRASAPDELQHDVPDPHWPWLFAGQVTHERRRVLAAQLKMLNRRVSGYLNETAGFLQGLEHHSYMDGLAHAKVAPAPSGPCTPDSFRLYEALEAGCVPLADAVTPEGWEGYWDLVYPGGVPFPVVKDWGQLGHVVGRELSAWPANANRCGAWWAARKRELAYRLDDDVRRVSGMVAADREIADLVTVIVTTSPIESHPSTAVIDETLDSLGERLPHCEVIVAVDGVRAEQAHMRTGYEEYLRRLLWRLARQRHSHFPLLADEFMHQANLTRWALEHVRTPLVLFIEHDTPLVGDVPWDRLATVVLRGAADVVRLSSETSVLDPWRYLFDAKPTDVMGVPLQRTGQWSQRPHLGRTSWYRNMIERHFPPTCRTMIEDVYYGVTSTPWIERRQWGEECKLWMYAPVGDMKRSAHLDGRAGAPKFEMVTA